MDRRLRVACLTPRALERKNGCRGSDAPGESGSAKFLSLLMLPLMLRLLFLLFLLLLLLLLLLLSSPSSLHGVPVWLRRCASVGGVRLDMFLL